MSKRDRRTYHVDKWLSLKRWVEEQEAKSKDELVPISRIANMMRTLDIGRTEDEWILSHFNNK